MQRCYVALGSNLDDPRRQVDVALAALAALPRTRLLAHSPWYRSRAVGPGEQPDYINGVALLETALEPLELLDALQKQEAAQGRERTERWGPRTIDLDLLLYGERLIDHPRLTVPHPRLAERAFVLCPLADLNPDLVLPDGTSLASRLDCCDRSGLQKLSD